MVSRETASGSWSNTLLTKGYGLEIRLTDDQSSLSFATGHPLPTADAHL